MRKDRNIIIRVAERDLDRLDLLAARYETSRAAIIRRLVRESVEHGLVMPGDAHVEAEVQ